MAHSHTCLRCEVVIERGDFDCDIDADHDSSYCGNCATEVNAWHAKHLGHDVRSSLSRNDPHAALICVDCNSTISQF